MCDEVTNVETKPNDKEAKTVPTNSYFTSIFINYYRIIDSYWYLLLFDKIPSKSKTFITISFQK